MRITFDHARGFYDEPFQLALASETAGATIRYTVDGSEPTASNGADYVEPFEISSTTTLRAAAFLAGERGEVFTQSYLFLNSVLGQTGDGLPNTWGFVTDYEVDTEITTATEFDDIINAALRTIPSVSLVLDPANLFGIVDGIYANPMMDGLHFEPTASFEWLDEANGSFGSSQRDATLTIEHSTGSVMPPDTPKLSFRAEFDVAAYSANGGIPVGSELRTLDALVLDAGYEDSWVHPDGFLRLGALYGRDEWFRQTQAAMGQPALAGSFVHLYLNGLYWGLYSAIEAPTAGAAARQLGGIAADYDVIGPSGPVAGDASAWSTLLSLVGGDTSQRATYDQIRAYLDLENLADFAILHRFASHRTTDAGMVRRASPRSELHVSILGLGQRGDLGQRLRRRPAVRSVNDRARVPVFETDRQCRVPSTRCGPGEPSRSPGRRAVGRGGPVTAAGLGAFTGHGW